MRLILIVADSCITRQTQPTARTCYHLIAPATAFRWCPLHLHILVTNLTLTVITVFHLVTKHWKREKISHHVVITTADLVVLQYLLVQPFYCIGVLSPSCCIGALLPLLPSRFCTTCGVCCETPYTIPWLFEDDYFEKVTFDNIHFENDYLQNPNAAVVYNVKPSHCILQPHLLAFMYNLSICQSFSMDVIYLSFCV